MSKVIFTWNDNGQKFTEAEQEALKNSARIMSDRLLSGAFDSGEITEKLIYNNKPSREVKGFWRVEG